MRRTLIIAAGLVLLIPTALFPQEPGSTPAPPAASIARSCEPDADLSGLVAALREAAGKYLPDTLDRLMLQDAALALEARAAERAALCRRIDAQLALAAALEASLGLRARLTDLARQDRDLYAAEWEASLKRTIPPPKSCLWGQVLWGVGGFAAGVAAERD